MTQQNAGGSNARRTRCLDEFASLEHQRLPAHDAGGREPAHRADDEEQACETAPTEEGRKDDHDEQVRQRVEHIDEAHHQIVGPAADVTGDRAPGEPDHHAHRRGEQTDQQRNAYPIEGTHEEVPAQAIRAQPVRGLPLRRHGEVLPVEGIVAIGAQKRPRDRH